MSKEEWMREQERRERSREWMREMNREDITRRYASKYNLPEQVIEFDIEGYDHLLNKSKLELVAIVKSLTIQLNENNN